MGATGPGPRGMLRLACAQIRHRPLRALTIAAAVIAATVCVAAIVILDRNTVLTRCWIAAQEWGDPDLVVTFPPATLADSTALVEEARRGSDIDAVLGVFRADRTATDLAVPVYLLAGDVERFRFLDLPSESAPAAVVLGSAATASRSTVRVAGVERRIDARANSRYFAGNEGADGVFFPASTSGLPEDLRVRPVLWLRTERPAEVRMRYAGRAMIQDAPHRSLWMTPEDSAMRAAVKVASLLTLVLAAFVLAHVTRVGLLERSRELAVFRALGLSRRRILRLGLLEVVLVAAPAAIAGIPLGAATAHALGRAGISTLGRFKVWFMDFPVGDASLVLVAGIVIPLLGAWFSLRTILRIDAAAALGPVFTASPPVRPGRRAPEVVAAAGAIVVGAVLAVLLARVESPGTGGLLLHAGALVAAMVALVVLLPLLVAPAASGLRILLSHAFGAMGRLAARTGGDHALRPAIVGVTGVFAIILTLDNLVRAMETEISGWGREALLGRAYVRTRDGLSTEDLARVRRHAPGLVVLPLAGEWLGPVAIRALDLSSLLGSPLLEPGDDLVIRAVMRGEGVIASRAFALRHGLEVGDRHAFGGPGGLARIAAVTDRFASLDSDRVHLVVGPGFARERLGLPADARPRAFMAWTRDRKPLRDADRRGIGAALGDRLESLATGGGRLEKRLAKTRQDFLIFDAVWVFLVLLALVATVGTIGLRALERRRELALVRALGATSAQFRAFFTAQGFAIGATGGLLALLVALPFTVGALAGLRAVSGMDVAFVYSGAAAARALGLASGLGVLAGIVAARRARRIDWAAALKYE